MGTLVHYTLAEETEEKMFKLFFSLALTIVFPCVLCDPCPLELADDPFATYSDSMGCVYAEPFDRYDNYDDALFHCREILGEKGRVAEILSAEDQATVLEIMKLAQAENEYPELSYWWSGFRDDNDDGQWEWVETGTASYTNWNHFAAPDHSSYNCMQLLSATGSEGEWMTFLCGDDYINTHPLCQLPN